MRFLPFKTERTSKKKYGPAFVQQAEKTLISGSFFEISLLLNGGNSHLNSQPCSLL